MTDLYHNATQMACVIAAPVVAVLALFANPVLMAWTGRPNIAHQAAPIMALYAVGNGLAWLSSFPYYLQYAKGNLRLHLIGNTIQLLFLVPLIFFAAEHYGPVGTGMVWALSNALFFLIYAPIVHTRFIPHVHGTWLCRDILSIVVPVAVAGEMLSFILPWPKERWLIFFQIAAAGLLLLAIAALSSSMIRNRLLAFFRSRKPMTDGMR